MASFSARREDHFQKNCPKPKRIFPSDFVKLVSEILYFFLAEKWSFVVSLVVLFCLFVATLPDFGVLFFTLKYSSRNELKIEINIMKSIS